MATPRISFEFFPPQTLDASFRLWETVQALAPRLSVLRREGAGWLMVAHANFAQIG